jgi:hypothetical protein
MRCDQLYNEAMIEIRLKRCNLEKFMRSGLISGIGITQNII